MRVGRGHRLAVGACATLLIAGLSGIASATHGGGYWFYNGNVPNAGGDRTAGPHPNQCCNELQEVRMSWSPGSHDMTFILIRVSDYGWSGFNADNSDTDQFLFYNVSTFTAGGCQNPAGMSTVYVNCRVGNKPFP